MKDYIQDYIQDYDDDERDFWSIPPGCWFWIGVLAAIAITIGVLIAFNS